jgi:hypothetical protein
MDPMGHSSRKYGGAVREAGGAFGAMGAAREEQYFRAQDEQKLDDLRRVMDQRDNKQAQNLSQADQNKDNGNAKSKK